MRDPSERTALTYPPEIAANEQYIGTLEETESRPYAGPPRYDKNGKPQEISIVWKFSLRVHHSLKQITNQDGSPFTLWRFTSDATGPGSTARDIMQALAGGELTDRQVSQLLHADPDFMPNKLCGKSCVVILGAYKDRQGQDRIGINGLLPLGKTDAQRLKKALEREPEPADEEDDQSPRMGSRTVRRFDQNGNEVYVQERDQERAREPAAAGARGVPDDELPF